MPSSSWLAHTLGQLMLLDAQPPTPTSIAKRAVALVLFDLMFFLQLLHQPESTFDRVAFLAFNGLMLMFITIQVVRYWVIQRRPAASG